MTKSEMPVPAMQIIEAKSDAERARILLTMPDAVLLAHGEDLKKACVAIGLLDGRHYVSARLFAVHAVRDKRGRLSETMVDFIECMAEALCEISGAADAP